MQDLTSYPGAKTNSGIMQFLINEIPYHFRYIEAFGGSGQVMENKRTAAINIINDIDFSVYQALAEKFLGRNCNEVHNSCWQKLFAALGPFDRSDFIYLDPPYPEAARRSGKAYYRHEMLSDHDHTQLLMAIVAMDANIMISTRPNELYDRILLAAGWRKLEFETMGRRGKCIEVIYMNYPPPHYLHEYTHVGCDYKERQQLARVKQRCADKLKRMPTVQLHIWIQELIKHDPAAVKHFLGVSAGKFKTFNHET